MWSYQETKDIIQNVVDNKEDYIDKLFLPMGLALHYKVFPLISNKNQESGIMSIDHSHGKVIMKPDKDSQIIFYSNVESVGNQIRNDEIRVYLDQDHHLVFDLPRFGAISRQSEITFNGTKEDQDAYTNLISLIDYDIRLDKNQELDDIKFMDRLQFQDDISSVVSSDGKEKLRFIQQLLNDSLQDIDDDLIDFLIIKIKKKYNPLKNKSTEDNVRKLIVNDFKNRLNEHNEFIVVEKQKQIEENQKRLSASNQLIKHNNAIPRQDIDEIFKNARQLKKEVPVEKHQDGAQQDVTSDKDNHEETQSNETVAKKKIIDRGNENEQRRVTTKTNGSLEAFFQ